MDYAELFRFNALISVPVFTLIAIWLIRTSPGFLLSRHTVSETIEFIHGRWKRLVFRLNLLLKSLLDAGFTVYLSVHFRLPVTYPIIMFDMLSVILFGALAYFVIGKHSDIHRIFVFTSAVCWMLGQLFLARSIGSIPFIRMTDILIPAPVIIMMYTMATNKTNAFIQAVCMVFWYIWLLIFCLRYQ